MEYECKTVRVIFIFGIIAKKLQKKSNILTEQNKRDSTVTRLLSSLLPHIL